MPYPMRSHRGNTYGPSMLKWLTLLPRYGRQALRSDRSCQTFSPDGLTWAWPRSSVVWKLSVGGRATEVGCQVFLPRAVD